MSSTSEHRRLTSLVPREAYPRTQLLGLKELWFHTGTACNLECPFCLEGSKPADTRLERIKLADIQPFMLEAVRLNVQRFAFTGGEPLIVKDIVKILEFALQLRPCLILTNGTAPLLKRVHQLQLLTQQPQSLSFRVSLDYPDEQAHDAGRGWGNFKRALDGLKVLHQRGFSVSIARQLRAEEDSVHIEGRYRELLKRIGLPTDIRITALPDFGRPGSAQATAAEDFALTANPMCTRSRMVLKKDGRMQVYACPLVDDDEHFAMGATLETATGSVTLRHHRCAVCAKHCTAYGDV